MNLDDTDVGYGGTDDWAFGCPYGGSKGYRWLVVFDVPRGGKFVPNLISYMERLGGTWTGPGRQVTVHPIKSGIVKIGLSESKRGKI